MSVMRVLRRLISSAAFAWSAMATLPARADEAAVAKLLDRIPPHAHAAVLVPNLKLASDELTHMLEGMQRANILMGARPYDQAIAALGLNVGVDEHGGGAVIFLATGDESLAPVFLIPVTDAEAFFEANFERGESEFAYVRKGGAVIRGRSLESHAVIAEQEEVIRDFDPAGGSVEALREALQPRAWSMLEQGEVVGFMDAVAAAHIERQVNALTLQLRRPQDVVSFAADVERAVFAIDFDPLAAVIHSFVQLDPEQGVGKALARGNASAEGLSRLPDKPFYLAWSIDVAGAGGPRAIAPLLMALDLPALPDWAMRAASVQFAAYPSPAGLAGGLFNDAAVVLVSDDPAAVRESFRERLSGNEPLAPGFEHQFTWTDDKPLKSGGTVDAFELRVRAVDEQAIQAASLQPVLFGNAGMRGFARVLDDALIITMSQRPAVLEAFTEVASDPALSLARNATIQTMRELLPRQPEIEIYVGVGQMWSFASTVWSTLPFGPAAMLPKDPGLLDPIGCALDVYDHAVETGTVIPASVLAMMMDFALKPVEATKAMERRMQEKQEAKP